jgi:toxin ParE1/3/4
VRLVYRPSFVDDLARSYTWIAQENLSAAERFLDIVEAAALRLTDFPDMGAPRDELRLGLRSLRVRPFKHLVFYRTEGANVVLIRLLHGAQDLPKRSYSD